MFLVNYLDPLAWHTECAFARDTDGSLIEVVREAFISELIGRLRSGNVSPIPMIVDPDSGWGRGRNIRGTGHTNKLSEL